MRHRVDENVGEFVEARFGLGGVERADRDLFLRGGEGWHDFYLRLTMTA